MKDKSREWIGVSQAWLSGRIQAGTSVKPSLTWNNRIA